MILYDDVSGEVGRSCEDHRIRLVYHGTSPLFEKKYKWELRRSSDCEKESLSVCPILHVYQNTVDVSDCWGTCCLILLFSQLLFFPKLGETPV